MNRPWHILVVDDDLEIQELLSDYLRQHHFRVSTAGGGVEMRKILKQQEIDLVVLDIMLPGDDGLALCRELRQKSAVLVIMLSAVSTETDRIVGLEVGADDYLTKPFNPRELLARIKALIRRSTGNFPHHRQAQLIDLPTIRFLDWQLDLNRRQLLAADGIIVPLTTGEYELLLTFLENPQRVLSRDQLLDITRGRQSGPFDRTIDVQVGRLRKKIEVDPKDPKIIITVRNEGYQLMAEISREPRTDRS